MKKSVQKLTSSLYICLTLTFPLLHFQLNHVPLKVKQLTLLCCAAGVSLTRTSRCHRSSCCPKRGMSPLTLHCSFPEVLLVSTALQSLSSKAMFPVLTKPPSGYKQMCGFQKHGRVHVLVYFLYLEEKEIALHHYLDMFIHEGTPKMSEKYAR